MSSSQSFALKQVAKHNYTLRHTCGSGVHTGTIGMREGFLQKAFAVHLLQCCRIYPLQGRNHPKYEKYLWEDGVTH